MIEVTDKRIKSSKYSFMKFMPEHLVFDKEEGCEIRFLSMFEMPNWSGVEDEEYTHIVDNSSERLDKLAAKYWGIERQDLHWIIAARNGLDLPDVQLYNGRVLKIPSKNWIDTKFMPQASNM